MNKTILITGAAGYIGSVLSRPLLESGYKVIGLDILKFDNDSILEIMEHPNYSFIYGDVRDYGLVKPLLKGVYGVVHLAAIVGDPACAKEPDLAIDTNWTASKKLFDLCNREPSVKRFIFASTCSNYGKMNGEEYLDENSALRPVSLYANLKVRFEKYLLNARCREDLSPTSLRFATVYGLSPRVRFDLTVNEFMRDAALKSELVIYGEKFWRPYCHVSDLARAVQLVLESPEHKVKHNVFGVGDTDENYQKKTIAEEIVKILPSTRIQYIDKKEDPRNYKVNFSKIKNELGFSVHKRLPDGLNEIYEALSENKINEPFSKKYANV